MFCNIDQQFRNLKHNHKCCVKIENTEREKYAKNLKIERIKGCKEIMLGCVDSQFAL
jgi:hypothetical protein